jgi:DNA-binding XRE family transcriptional regulator
MPAAGGPPHSFLAGGSSWMDSSVSFDVSAYDRPLLAACETVWALSAQVRSARGARGLPLSDVAALAHVRRQTVSDIEQGKTWPDVATVARLLGALGLTLTAVTAGGTA